MPCAFIGHGNPMNTLQSNRFTDVWAAFGRAIPKPRAVLAISAHWFIGASAVTAMAAPRTIHDFFGFPQELFAFEYAAPGSPELAEEVAEIVKPAWIGFDHDSWGIDHGTWSVLHHVLPAADVPVVQLSVDATKPSEYHLDLGARLAPLREQGVLILASGNIVHNLRLVDMSRSEAGFDWGVRFDDAVREQLTGASPDQVLKLDHDPDYRLAVPTPDHYWPVLYVAGLASAAGEATEVIVDGNVYGSLSMTSYTLGLSSLP